MPPLRLVPTLVGRTPTSVVGGAELSYTKLSWFIVGVALVSLATALAAIGLVPLSNTTYVAAMITLQGDRKAIQHAEGGVVAALLVEEGQEVRPGQELVTLDSGRVRSASLDARAQYCALRLETSRLQQIAKLNSASIVDADDGVKCDFAGLSEVDQRASATKAAAYVAHVRALELQQASLRTGLGEMSRRRALSSDQAALDQTELSMRNELERWGYGSKLVRIAAQRQLLMSQSAGFDVDQRSKDLQDRLAQSVADLVDFQKSYENGLLVELDKVTRALSEARARMHVLDDQEAHLSIRSPVRGYVLGLNVHSVGSVVPAGAVIMEIVPVGPRMMIEGRARPGDFPTLSAGQLVQARVVRASGRPLTLRARLVDLSSDRMTDRADNSFFVFHAQFEADQDIPTGLIRAGLPVDLVITTGQQTPLEAFLGPLLFWLQGRK